MRLTYIAILGVVLLLFPIFCVGETIHGPINSRQTFLADLNRLEIGYTTVQVEEIMGTYIKGTNWQLFGSGDITIPGTKRRVFEIDTSNTNQLALKDCNVYRHSNDGEYNSDWGIICYKNGKVDYIDFAPD